MQFFVLNKFEVGPGLSIKLENPPLLFGLFISALLTFAKLWAFCWQHRNPQCLAKGSAENTIRSHIYHGPPYMDLLHCLKLTHTITKSYHNKSMLTAVPLLVSKISNTRSTLCLFKEKIGVRDEFDLWPKPWSPLPPGRGGKWQWDPGEAICTVAVKAHVK